MIGSFSIILSPLLLVQFSDHHGSFQASVLSVFKAESQPGSLSDQRSLPGTVGREGLTGRLISLFAETVLQSIKEKGGLEPLLALLCLLKKPRSQV